MEFIQSIDLMGLLKCFVVGGIICIIGQLLIDKTKLTPARILVIFVTAGAILGGIGIYQKLVDYAVASATCYPAFKIKTIDNEKYIDGGFYDNVPIQLAIDMGADNVIVVDLQAVGFKRKVKCRLSAGNSG